LVLDTLYCVGSFDHVYINVDGYSQTNEEASSATQHGGGDDDDDADADDSDNHLSITKWLANEAQGGLDNCRDRDDDDDNETASTSADITDSSTDYDVLETSLAVIGSNKTLEAPPPPVKEDCYYIPCIEDYALVKKQPTTVTATL
jgi:hypothetical protein